MLIFFIISLILFTIIFHPVLLQLYKLYLSNPDNSHGILIPFVFLYLIWTKKNELKHIHFETSFIGLIIIILGLFLYFLGFKGHIAFLENFSLIITFIGLLWYHMGTKFIKKIIFPLFILFFMIPIPLSLTEFFSFPLKLLTTEISETILKFFSIPVFREGNLLYFPNGPIEVAKACSGLRSLVSFILLSLIFAYLSKNKKARLIIILIAIPIAIFANIFRVTLTGSLVYFISHKVVNGFFHQLLGIFAFIFGFSLMFILYLKLGVQKNEN